MSTAPRPCRRTCPGGNPCTCNEAVDHWLHICQHEACYCHTRQRYDEEKHRPVLARQKEPLHA